MGSATGFSAARMLQIEQSTVTGGFIDLDGRLLLERRDGQTIVAGVAKGDKGDKGDPGTNGLDYKYSAGFVQMWTTNLPPAGWVFCDGGELSRTTYAALFAVIGTTYGAGNGVDTFNVPDFRSRVPVGMNPAEAEFDLLGKAGGSKTHRHDFMIAMLDKNWSPAGVAGALGNSSTSIKAGAYRYSTGQFTGSTDSTPDTGTSSINSNINSGAATSQTVGRFASAGDTDLGSSLQPYRVINFVISLGSSGFVGGGNPIPTNSIGRGTTTERNALFGIPGTVAQQVALANQSPTWWNTTTRRIETYYAISGSAGLSVPGLWTSGFSAGWYPADASTEWAGKSGMNSFTSPYKTTWSRGVDSGGVLNATADGTGIRIGLTGIYECALQIRGGSDGNGSYAALGLNGDRAAFEARSTNLPIMGVWTHSHPAALHDFSSSYYMGQLLAGDLITGGPAVVPSNMGGGVAASFGLMTVRRIA